MLVFVFGMVLNGFPFVFLGVYAMKLCVFTRCGCGCCVLETRESIDAGLLVVSES